MIPPKHIVSGQLRRLRLAALVTASLVAGCSGSTNSPSADSTTNTQTPVNSGTSNSANNDDVADAAIHTTGAETSTPTEVGSSDVTDEVPDGTVPTNPVVADPLVQNTLLVNFDINVPAYQSSELLIGLEWGDMSITVMWVGDEYWSASSELPTETDNLLTVTFYDKNGDIALASYTQEFRTGSNASETLEISADQFSASEFDDDRDGVSNLDELKSGTDPLLDEDALLEIIDVYALSDNSTFRMSVSNDFESKLTDERPFVYTFERHPAEGGYPGSDYTHINIDTQGNGTYTYNSSFLGTYNRRYGTRTKSGRSINWEGTRYNYDGDYTHTVSFNNTVTVVDENTRSFVEEIQGSYSGTTTVSWSVSSNLSARIIDGTSFCMPVAGTALVTHVYNRGGPEGSSPYETTVSKEIDDLYWRVVRVYEGNEISELFARELAIHVPYFNASAEPRSNSTHFICDFVDI